MVCHIGQIEHDMTLCGLQESLSEEKESRVATEEELAAARAALEEQKAAAEAAKADASQRVQELGEELAAATEALNSQESQNKELQAQAEGIRERYLSAQYSVEAEQGTILRLQKEISRLQSVEIDNEYLQSENTKIRGELGELSSSLGSTRAALEKAKACLCTPRMSATPEYLSGGNVRVQLRAFASTFMIGTHLSCTLIERMAGEG